MNNRFPRKLSFAALTLIVILTSCGADDDSTNVGKTGEGGYPGPEDLTLPYFRVTTDETIRDEPKVIAEVEVYTNQELDYSGTIGIEFRGSTSQRIFDKKSYGLETWDASGNDISVPLLGWGSEEDWILYGPYSDKTLLRNVLLYELSNDLGNYAVRTTFAELELNGADQGAYVFMEKIKRDNNRLDLEQLDRSMTSADLISGGYILKIDKTTGDTNNPDWPGDFAYTAELGFRSSYGVDENELDYEPYGTKQGEETYFLYEYPRAELINEEQKTYIQEYIHDFETALIEETFEGSERAYEDYIDVTSFVDFFLLNELSGNPDAYRLSTFLHKDRGQKLKMGPVWDINLGFGNDGRSATNVWIYQYNDSYPEDAWLVPFWWEKLLDDPLFRAAVKERWQALRVNILATHTVLAMIDSYVATLESNGMIDRNFSRWPVLGVALPFNSYVGASYEGEITYVKNWCESRFDWMDQEISSW